VDSFDALVVAEVGSGGVTSVDSEELTLNVGLQVIDPVDALDIRVT